METKTENKEQNIQKALETVLGSTTKYNEKSNVEDVEKSNTEGVEQPNTKGVEQPNVEGDEQPNAEGVKRQNLEVVKKSFIFALIILVIAIFIVFVKNPGLIYNYILKNKKKIDSKIKSPDLIDNNIEKGKGILQLVIEKNKIIKI